MDDKAAVKELKLMIKKNLDTIQHEYVWVICCCKNCKNVHRVRDYGISPFYYSNQFGFIKSDERFWCEKHKIFKRKLIPIYGFEKVIWKLVDQNKNSILTNEEKIKLKNKRAYKL